MMQFELAPLEGITGYVYRNAYHKHYRPMARYYAPFLSPKTGARFSSREKNDILPEHNQGIHLIPQILAKDASLFLGAADFLKNYGYTEVNLNLGCPSPTVTAKGKGAAMLQDAKKLDAFLDTICNGLEARGMHLSVKTRIGFSDAENFPALLAVYSQYPLTELIIHPRIRDEFYGKTPHADAFLYAASHSILPLSYNGDITNRKSFTQLMEACPTLSCIMLGRGLLTAPWLAESLRALSSASFESPSPAAQKARLRAFHDTLLSGYAAILSGDQPVLAKMKEVWFYMGALFSENEKYMKELRKSKRLRDYQTVVDGIFSNLPFDADFCKK